MLQHYRVGDIRHCIADTTRARDVLGFEAARSLEEGLPVLIEWSRRQSPEDSVERSLVELKDRGLIQ